MRFSSTRRRGGSSVDGSRALYAPHSTIEKRLQGHRQGRYPSLKTVYRARALKVMNQRPQGRQPQRTSICVLKPLHPTKRAKRLQEDEMPAYVIFIRERTLDQSELDTYAKMAGPSLEGLPIKFLAAYGRQELLEGPAPEGVAIAEFPSMEEAKRWYESPAYQAAAQHRFKGATYRGFIVEGV